MSDIPEELKMLASAYSSQNVACNRIWAVSAIMLVSIYCVIFKDGSATILGISISENYFYIATFFISTVLNFSYCSMHSKIYEIGDMYRNLIQKHGLSKKFLAHSRIYGRPHSKSDLLHSIVTPNYNRVYPLRKTIDNIGEKTYIPDTIYNIYKFIVDFFYSIIPFSSAFISLIEIINQKHNPMVVALISFIFLLFSIPSTGIMISAIWRWSFNK